MYVSYVSRQHQRNTTTNALRLNTDIVENWMADQN